MQQEIRETIKEEISQALADASAELGKVQNRAEQKGILDIIQEKLASRKLIVFITSTELMWHGLDPETWGMIAMCYIGGQSAVDFAKTWRHGG